MKKLQLTLLLVGVLYGVTSAQWVTNGPFGGAILTSTQVGNDLFIGTAKGIYKSTNGGLNWQFHHAVVPDMIVNKLFFDGTVLYAGLNASLTAKMPFEGLYISQDTGKNWTHITAVIGANFITSIVKANGKIFILNKSVNNEMFYSTDQGKTWNKQVLPIFINKLFAFDNTLFFTRSSYKIPYLYRSTDDGVNWKATDTGMAGTFTNTILKVGNNLYAFNNPLTYISSNDGISWTELTSNPIKNPKNSYNWPPGIVCYNGQKFFGSNGGNSSVEIASISPTDTQWVFITNGLPDGSTWAMFNHTTDVFLCKEDELYRTSNGGSSWSLINSGINAIAIRSVAAYGNDIYCGSDRRINYSNNNAQSWKIGSIPGTIYGLNDIYRLGSTLFASTSGSGIFESTDNGATWGSQSLSSQYFYRFAHDGTTVYCGSDDAIYKTSNNGSTWTSWSGGIPSNTVILDLKVLGSDIYAGIGTGAGGSPGVYKSTLASAAWTRVSSGLNNRTSYALENIGNTLYTGTESGVFKSSDFGNSWTAENIGIEKRNINDLLAYGNDLIAATDSGVWVLPSGTSAWVSKNFNLPMGKVNSISANNDYLFAATESASIWQMPLWQVGLTAAKKAESLLVVQPNPAEKTISLQYSMSESENLSLTILDRMGRIVFYSAVVDSRTSYNISHLKNGMYFVLLNGATLGSKVTAITQKLVVQH